MSTENAKRKKEKLELVEAMIAGFVKSGKPLDLLDMQEKSLEEQEHFYRGYLALDTPRAAACNRDLQASGKVLGLAPLAKTRFLLCKHCWWCGVDNQSFDNHAGRCQQYAGGW